MRKAVAPGKLILSGEHAVVYNQPALAMAVNRYATAWVSPQQGAHIAFDLLNLRYHKKMTLSALKKLKTRLHESYQSFLEGDRPIRDVLKLPYELSTYAFSHLLDKLNHQLSDGVKLSSHSDIPLGCGMGSSAAMILSVMHALALQQGLSISSEQYLEHARETEHLQHGRSSGVDLHVSLRGGALHYHQGQISERPLPTIPLWIINTGKPKSSTGECVAAVASKINTPQCLHDFAQVTTALDAALSSHNFPEIQRCIKENHALLTDIGVVPEPIQELIELLMARGIAAKICGAGAIGGDKAGIVLLVAEKLPSGLPDNIVRLIEHIEGDHRGLHSL